MEVLLLVLVVVRDAVLATEADGEVVVHRLVVQKILLDHLAAVAEAEHEVSEAVMRVELHDVPENGTASHLDQGLRTELGLFAQARAESAAEDDCLHLDAYILRR